MIEYGFFFWWEYVMFAGITVVFIVPVICILLGVSIKILNKLNFVQTDGDWGTLDLMKSFYSELYPEYFDDEKWFLNINGTPAIDKVTTQAIEWD